MSPIVYAIPIFLSTIVIEIVVAHFRGRQVYDTADEPDAVLLTAC